jgi:glycosyltransferase involved in cell wall biosynthesis
MLIPDKISAYLYKRASNIWHIENDIRKYFQYIIVVPAIAESSNLPKLIKSLEKNDKLELHNTLLLIVVNNSTSSSEEVKSDNQKNLAYLRKIKSKVNISFIDACSAGKEMDDKNGGVGLARKIGMDLALTKFDYLSINKNDMFQKLNSAIHTFAKRQMTWFRKMEREGVVINWIDGADFNKAKQLIKKSKDVIASKSSSEAISK